MNKDEAIEILKELLEHELNGTVSFDKRTVPALEWAIELMAKSQREAPPPP